MSKGSNRRREDVKKIRDNWDTIFGKKNEDEKEQKPQDQAKQNAK